MKGRAATININAARAGRYRHHASPTIIKDMHVAKVVAGDPVPSATARLSQEVLNTLKK